MVDQAGPSPQGAAKKGQKITILIVDDHALFRKGIRRVLEDEADIECVDTDNAETAVKLTSELRPHIALVDIAMPGMDGIELARRIKSANTTTAVVILSAYRHEQYVLAAIKADVDGYLLKSMHPRDLKNAIRLIYAGESVFNPQVTQQIARRIAGSNYKRGTSDLHSRELQILRLAAGGMTNKQIAAQLSISTATVRTHMDNIFRRLDVKSRTEAVSQAFRLGFFGPDDVCQPIQAP